MTKPVVGGRPRHRPLPILEWPSADQAAWAAACRKARPLQSPGGAAHWATATRDIAAAAWGRFLSFLAANGELAADVGPADRLTFDRCGRFIIGMRAHLAPNTINVAVIFLGQALKVMVPNKDWAWVQKHPAKPTRAEIRATRKPIMAPDSAQLLAAALAACDAIDTPLPTVVEAQKYRNAVLIALAVCIAVRRRNLAEMRLGVHLLVGNTGMRVMFDGTVKNSQIIDTPLTPMLCTYLHLYLDRYRPILLKGAPDTDALWIDQAGQPLTYGMLYGVFQRTGIQLVGQKLSAHSVRYGLATGIMGADPRKIDIASAALAHRSTRMMQAYDKSGAEASNRIWTRLVDRKRRK